MKQDLEVGNMAFMGFPTIYGSYETVSAKIDEIAEETGWTACSSAGPTLSAVSGISEKRSSHAWRASELIRQQRQTIAC